MLYSYIKVKVIAVNISYLAIEMKIALYKEYVCQ
jgi:hypothetical protein